MTPVNSSPGGHTFCLSLYRFCVFTLYPIVRLTVCMHPRSWTTLSTHIYQSTESHRLTACVHPRSQNTLSVHIYQCTDSHRLKCACTPDHGTPSLTHIPKHRLSSRAEALKKPRWNVREMWRGLKQPTP